MKFSFAPDLLNLSLDVFSFAAIYFFLVIIFETIVNVSLRELEPKCFPSILRTADQAESANPPGPGRSRLGLNLKSH
jgi:hypothetical protein